MLPSRVRDRFVFTTTRSNSVFRQENPFDVAKQMTVSAADFSVSRDLGSAETPLVESRTEPEGARRSVVI
jgi:hypothetical protein